MYFLAMVFFFKLIQSPTFFLIHVPVRRFYWSDVCTCQTFLPVRSLYQSDVCTSPTFVPVRRLYQYNVSTSLTFVPVRRLCQSVVCTSPTFMLSDLCSVRRLWVRRLYWYRIKYSNEKVYSSK